MARQGVRTSTLGLVGRQQNLFPTPSQQSASARAGMAGFDQMPKSLRAFLREWGGSIPPKGVVQIVDVLKGGYGIEITTPDGKKHVLAPDPPTR